jgi:hypothetical protein
MDHSLFRYDEPYTARGPRRKVNFFAWTIVILLLIGLTLAAWIGSYYIFGQPERPDSYKVLQKLGKIEQPKRFQLTAAPSGEFLRAKQLFERYGEMRSAELAKTNGELARYYIRNFQQVRAVTYVVGRFTIMQARELTPDDLFPSGMVALTNAVDYPELLMEHVYPASPQSVPLMKQTLATGLEIKLDRTHDLSAVVHAERLGDGRLLITAVPLLYGTYTVTQGRGMFSLEPPFALNMAAGWPLFKERSRRAAEEQFASYREKVSPSQQGVPIPGLAATPTPGVTANELVRVETAQPIVPVEPVVTPTPAPAVAAKPTPTPKGGKLAKGSPSPGPGASPSPIVVAAASPGAPARGASPAAALSPAAASPGPAVAAASPSPAIPAASPAVPAPGDALASTAGGGTWKTYPSGKMPVGRLITTGDLAEVAERGLAGERLYLRGQFVVNFTESNRAVLRPRSNMAESVLRLGAPSSTRIIVEFPAGYTPPAQGSTVNRDEARPYEITEVRKQEDGQLNVFVREIMQ